MIDVVLAAAPLISGFVTFAGVYCYGVDSVWAAVAAIVAAAAAGVVTLRRHRKQQSYWV